MTTVGRMHAFPRSVMRVMLGMATREAGMISLLRWGSALLPETQRTPAQVVSGVC